MLAYNSSRDYATRPERKTQPNRRIQEQPERVKHRDPASKEKLAWIGTVLVCITIATVLLNRYAAIAQENYHLVYLQDQVTKDTATNAMLHDEVTSLASPQRIMGIAQKMGMTEVVPQQLTQQNQGGVHNE